MTKELSGEERDQLDRSTKKAKFDGSSQDTVVMESQDFDAEGRVLPNNNDKKVFETATGMGLKRQQVSYKDVCLGFNGGTNSDDTSEEEDWFVEDDDSIDDPTEDEETGEEGEGS